MPTSGPPVVAGPPPAAARPGRGPLALLTLGVAVLALVVALGAVILAWRAGDRSQQAQDRVAELAGGGASATPVPPSPGEPGGEPATATPTDPTGLDPSAGPVDRPLDPQAEYRPAYAKDPLALNIGACDSSGGIRYLDLDEPRVNVDEDQGDLNYGRESCSDQQITLGWRGEASQVDAAVTPNECADRIRTASLSQAVPARRGLVLCLVTSGEAARAEGISKKIALVEVVGVNDQTVSVQVSAWHVPE